MNAEKRLPRGSGIVIATVIGGSIWAMLIYGVSLIV